MKILHLKERTLSPKAAELVQFDRDSILRVVAASHEQQPEVWLADPDQYEKGGRIQRDSTAPRLLAYSHGGRAIYVTDGCNSCRHALKADLKDLTSAQLQSFAEETGIPTELLKKLTTIPA